MNYTPETIQILSLRLTSKVSGQAAKQDLKMATFIVEFLAHLKTISGRFSLSLENGNTFSDIIFRIFLSCLIIYAQFHRRVGHLLPGARLRNEI